MRPAWRCSPFDVIYRNEEAGDDVLADAISNRGGNVILARDPKIGPAHNGVYTTSDTSSLSAVLENTNHAEGQVHLDKDPADGVSRSLPLVVSSEDDSEFIPALSVLAVMMQRGINPSQFIVRPDGIQMGNRFIPTGDAKSMR